MLETRDLLEHRRQLDFVLVGQGLELVDPDPASVRRLREECLTSLDEAGLLHGYSFTSRLIANVDLFEYPGKYQGYP